MFCNVDISLLVKDEISFFETSLLVYYVPDVQKYI